MEHAVGVEGDRRRLVLVPAAEIGGEVEAAAATAQGGDEAVHEPAALGPLKGIDRREVR
jgi:hypothetical protein